MTLIALCATALFVTMTAIVFADDTTTTTTTTAAGGSTTTTSESSSTTGSGSTSSTASTTSTTVEYWMIHSWDFKDFKAVPSSISVSDRRLAWTGITPGGFSSMYVWDMRTKTNKEITEPLPGNYYNPCASGKLVVYQGGRAGGYDDIFMYDIDNAVVTQLTHNSDPGDANDSNPRIDGNRVVWQKDMVGSDAKPGIYLLELDKSKPTCILPGGEYSDPDISGDYVVAVKNSSTDTSTQIVLYNIETQAVREIAAVGTNNEHPRISRNRVVWSSGDPPSPIYYPWTTYQVTLYDIPTGKSLPLTNNKFGNATPAIDGTTISWEQELKNGIGVVDFDRMVEGVLEGDTDEVKSPEVTQAPEGAYIVYYGGTKIYYAWPEKFGFIDSQPGDDYATAIKFMASKAVIEGYTDTGSQTPTYFGTWDPVTRQQYAKMILLTMALYDPVVYTASEHDTLPNFADAASIDNTAGNLYPYHYIAKAARTGLTFGFTDGTFRPLDNITRQQVITMIVRAARDKFAAPPADWQGSLSYVDPEHGERIRTAEYNGLLDGIVANGDGTLYGWDTTQNATRGEVAQMLYNLLRILGVSTTITE